MFILGMMVGGLIAIIIYACVIVGSDKHINTKDDLRGHWIDDWDIGCSVCSECDDSFLWEDFNGVREFNYCPTCGARMDEVKDV